MCVCIICTFIYSIRTFLYSVFIYFWCNKYVTDPHHTFLVGPFWHTVVALLHKHFLYIPSPFFNSASIITNCQYAAMSKHNVTIYDGYPESNFLLLILPLHHRGHGGVRVRRVCWFCGKAQTQFADIRTVSTHRAVFIMFEKIENTGTCGMRSVIHFLNVKNMKPPEIRQLCDLYGEHAMNSSVVWRWVRLFSEGQ